MATDKSVMAVIRAARPTFQSVHDKMAFSGDALSSTSTDEVGIDYWNEFEDEYAFLYSDPDNGSKKALAKSLTMNNKLLVDALSHGSSKPPVHLEINSGTRDLQVIEPPIPLPYPAGPDFHVGRGMVVGPPNPLFGGIAIRIYPHLPRGLPGVPLGAHYCPCGRPILTGFGPNRFARYLDAC